MTPADVLLGTIDLQGVADQLDFGGWQDEQLISRVRLTDLTAIGRIELLDDFTKEAPSRPPSPSWAWA